MGDAKALLACTEEILVVKVEIIIVKHTPTCCSFLPAGTACRTLISHIMQSGGTVPLLEPIPVAWDIRTRYMRV